MCCFRKENWAQNTFLHIQIWLFFWSITQGSHANTHCDGTICLNTLSLITHTLLWANDMDHPEHRQIECCWVSQVSFRDCFSWLNTHQTERLERNFEKVLEKVLHTQSTKHCCSPFGSLKQRQQHHNTNTTTEIFLSRLYSYRKWFPRWWRWYTLHGGRGQVGCGPGVMCVLCFSFKKKTARETSRWGGNGEKWVEFMLPKGRNGCGSNWGETRGICVCVLRKFWGL